MSAPFGFQDEGIAFLADRLAGLQADDPGLGKSRQTILAAAKIGARRIGVLTPKSGLGHWRREFRKWWPEDQPQPDLTVVNYDRISRPDTLTAAGLLFQKFDVLACDEAHALKNPDAARTRYVYMQLRGRARRTWLLSGTPAPNHAGEMWTHLYALAPELILHEHRKTPLSRDEFEDRYCKVGFDARGERVIRGSANVAELRERIAPFMLRRQKADVLPDLPPMIVDDYPLAPEALGADPITKAMLKRVLPEGPSPWPSDPTDAEGYVDAVLESLRDPGVAQATERRLTGMLKVPGVLAYLRGELENPGKLIVFAYHREVMDALEAGLRDMGHPPVRIDGSTHSANRDLAVWRFQTEPGVRVFLGQITACREVLTLTAADQVAFAEAEWSPSMNFQAASRAHRIGQLGSVLVRFLSLEGSFDAVIAMCLARKTRDFAALFN